jgi:hypothetical protein
MLVQGIERIVHGNQLLAIVVRAQVTTDQKYNFLTEPDNALQLGVNSYAGGEVIPSHSHLRPDVTVQSGQEFVLVNTGRLRVNLYDETTRELLSAQELGKGDMILLVSGAHGFEVLEPCQIVEVKQGPYLSKEKDKVVWSS